MTDLGEQSILVAGATGGIGAPICHLLAARGARLTLLGRNQPRLQTLGLDAAQVTGDLRDPETADRAVAAAIAAHGSLDGVVIASGIVAFGPLGELSDDALVEVFETNTLGPIRLLKSALPFLIESAQAGRSPFVVTVSAVVAEQPTAGMAAYSASKAALSAHRRP